MQAVIEYAAYFAIGILSSPNGTIVNQSPHMPRSIISLVASPALRLTVDHLRVYCNNSAHCHSRYGKYITSCFQPTSIPSCIRLILCLDCHPQILIAGGVGSCHNSPSISPCTVQTNCMLTRLQIPETFYLLCILAMVFNALPFLNHSI